MIEIAPDKVAHIIIKARELGAKVSAWDEDASRDAAGDILPRSWKTWRKTRPRERWRASSDPSMRTSRLSSLRSLGSAVARSLRKSSTRQSRRRKANVSTLPRDTFSAWRSYPITWRREWNGSASRLPRSKRISFKTGDHDHLTFSGNDLDLAISARNDRCHRAPGRLPAGDHCQLRERWTYHVFCL
jgi:hypothetical protein